MRVPSAVGERGAGRCRPASRFLIFPVALLLGSGCASARPAPTPIPSPASSYPASLKWLRTSAEYRAISLEIYRAATVATLARGSAIPAGHWAVILDADETVLDNSEQERRSALAGRGFSDSAWVAWVRERAAPAVPGSVEFIHAVEQAGGLVAIVTNRADSLCADTRVNLEAVGVRPAILLCKPPDTGDKNPRFAAVADGSAPGAPGPLTVVTWVGDNIQDFPALDQASRNDAGALSHFGERWFALPNPMYGSWQRNEEQ